MSGSQGCEMRVKINLVTYEFRPLYCSRRELNPHAAHTKTALSVMIDTNSCCSAQGFIMGLALQLCDAEFDVKQERLLS